jgi:peroxin-1
MTTPNTRGIILFASATSIAALHPLINAAHIFQDVVDLKPPDKNARRDVCSTVGISTDYGYVLTPVAQIIARIVKDRLSATQETDQALSLNYMSLATQTEGYSATDLQDLVSRALHRLAIRAPSDMSQVSDILRALYSSIKLICSLSRLPLLRQTSPLLKLTSSRCL